MGEPPATSLRSNSASSKMESSGDRGGDAFSSFLNPLESLDRGESAPGDDARGTAASGRVTPPLRGDTGGDGVTGGNVKPAPPSASCAMVATRVVHGREASSRPRRCPGSCQRVADEIFRVPTKCSGLDTRTRAARPGWDSDMSRAIASMSTRMTCPMTRASVGGGGARRSAVVTKAHRGRDDDEQIITERRVHVDAAAFTVTRRRLALTLATALALEPVTRERSPASAGALTDMVKRSNLGANLGLVEFDSPDLDYSFQYPRGWKVLRNRLRRGVIVSDFDAPVGNPKVYVEVVSAPPAGELEVDGDESSVTGEDANDADDDCVRKSQKIAIRRRAGEFLFTFVWAMLLTACFLTVEALVAPVENDNSGDGKLETPPMRLVKDLELSVNGFESYDYFTFASETTTRSGYDVTRRHYAAGNFFLFTYGQLVC